MNKEEWIESVLNSTKGMQKAEASPFLFEKIATRIASGETTELVNNSRMRWAFAAAAFVILSINIFSIISVSGGKPQVQKTEFVNSGPDQSVVYNY